MIGRADVRRALDRLVVVWPILAGKDALRQEIGEMVMRYADRLEPEDIDRGITLLVRTCRTSDKDGGPAWPPGPNEVSGCILTARSERMSAEPKRTDVRVTGPREVIGHHCNKCAGPLSYLAPERVLMCTRCVRVHVWEWQGSPRIHANPSESMALVLEDEVVVGTPDDGRKVVTHLAEQLAA